VNMNFAITLFKLFVHCRLSEVHEILPHLGTSTA